VPSWHFNARPPQLLDLEQVQFYVHSLHSSEPLGGFRLSTLCLSVGLVHSLHRSSSRVFNNSVSLNLSNTPKCVGLVHSLHLLKELFTELTEYSKTLWCLLLDTLLYELESKFSCAHLHLLNAHLTELPQSIQQFRLLCFLLHRLSSKLFSNLEAPSEFVNYSAVPT
jgi:hypothetical protein